MNILHVAPYKIIPPNKGGERAVFYLARALASKANLVSYTVQANKEDRSFDKIATMSNGRSRYLNPLISFRIRQMLQEQKADILLIEHPFIAFFIMLLRRVIPCPIAVRSHNIEFHRFQTINKFYWPIVRFVERYVHRKADINLFITAQDRSIALKEFKLPEASCFVLCYGVNLNKLPSVDVIEDNRKKVRAVHSISKETKILLFNGALGYRPNHLAVVHIIDEVLPKLQAQLSNFVIIICGGGLDEQLQKKIDEQDSILYAGFVDDIDLYFMGCDLFINPVIEGGGVKTKLIEALGFGKKVVSYQSSSYGTDSKDTGGRLIIIEDRNASRFSEEVINMLQSDITNDNTRFYQKHSWDNIAERLIKTFSKY